MAEYPGDMSDEDIKKKLATDIRGHLAACATGERQVTIDPATAAMLLELLPEPEPEDEHKAKAAAPKNASHDDEEETSSGRRSTRK